MEDGNSIVDVLLPVSLLSQGQVLQHDTSSWLEYLPLNNTGAKLANSLFEQLSISPIATHSYPKLMISIARAVNKTIFHLKVCLYLHNSQSEIQFPRVALHSKSHSSKLLSCDNGPFQNNNQRNDKSS